MRDLFSELSPGASGLEVEQFLVLSLIILIAAIIRGYAGFWNIPFIRLGPREGRHWSTRGSDGRSAGCQSGHVMHPP